MSVQLASTQCLHDHDLVVSTKRLPQVAHLPAVDEDADMRPYPVLLVDHAEANPLVAPIEVGEDGSQRGAARLGLARFGVRAQGARDEHLHLTMPTLPGQFRPRRSPAGGEPRKSTSVLRRGSPTLLRSSYRSTGPRDLTRPPSSPAASRSTTPAHSASRRLGGPSSCLHYVLHRPQVCLPGWCAATPWSRPSGRPMPCQRRAGGPPSENRCHRLASASRCPRASTRLTGDPGDKFRNDSADTGDPGCSGRV